MLNQREASAPPTPSPAAATPVLGAARKCGTLNCSADPVAPRQALAKDALEFSDGKQTTVEYACSCGEVRSMLAAGAPVRVGDSSSSPSQVLQPEE